MASKLAEAFVEVGMDASLLKKGMSGVQTFMRGQVTKLQAVSAQLSGAFGGAFGAIAGAAGFGLVIKSAADFEQAMRQSTAIMIGLTDQQEAQMKKVAKSVGAEFGVGATAAAEAFFFLASAGQTAEQAMASLGQVTAFATAGAFDLATATDLLTDAQSALGMTSKNAQENLAEMTRLSDVLVKANTLANASVSQFSQALTNKAGAALRNLGKDVEEGVAVLAAFADQGIKAQNAGTALNIVLRDLQTAAIKNKKAFAEAGISVFDANGEMNNIADIIAQLETKLGGMSDEMKKATLFQLGFTDKSISFAQSLIGTSDKIRKYEQDLRNAGGITREVAENQMDTFIGKTKKLKAALQTLAITIGTPVIEFLSKVTDKIQPIIVGMSQMSEKTAKLIVKITGMTAAFTGALFVIPKILGVVKALGAAMAFLALNPLGMAIAALGAFVVAIQSALANEALAGRLISAFNKIASSIATVFGFVKGQGQSLTETLSGTWMRFVEFVVSAIESIASKVESWTPIFSQVGSTIQANLAGPIEAAMSIFNTLKTVVSTVFNSIIGFLEANSARWTQWKDLIFNIIENISNMITQTVNFIMNAFAQMFPSIESGFGSFASFVLDIFGSILDAVSLLTTNFKKTWSLAVNFVKGLAIDFVLGWLLQFKLIQAAIVGVGAFFMSIFSKAILAIAELFPNFTQGVVDVAKGIKDAFVSAWTAIIDAGKAVGEFFMGLFDSITFGLLGVGGAAEEAKKKAKGDKAKPSGQVAKEARSFVDNFRAGLKPVGSVLSEASSDAAKAFNKSLKDTSSNPLDRATGAMLDAQSANRKERQGIIDSIREERDANIKEANERKKALDDEIAQKIANQKTLNDIEKQGAIEAGDAKKDAAEGDGEEDNKNKTEKAASKVGFSGVTELSKKIQDALSGSEDKKVANDNKKANEKTAAEISELANEQRRHNRVMEQNQGGARLAAGGT